MVEAKREIKHALEDRFDRDYQMWRLEKFQETGQDGEPIEGFRSYTSNEPRNFAKKMVAWCAQSEMVIQITHRTTRRHLNDEDDHKERFIIGVLTAADERLRNMGRLPLQDELGWHTSIRGWVAGRALMRKDEDGRTVIDITPWDVRNTYWEWGPDGLEWACHVTHKTRAQIRAQFGVEVPVEDTRHVRDPEEELLTVYDFYDREHNTICVERTEVKQATLHGSPRTPCYLAYVPLQPEIDTDQVNDPIADVGESVFDDIRQVYENYNVVMSVYLELVARQRKPSYTVSSKDGQLVLQSDPYMEGSEIALKEGEKVELLDMVQTTKDAEVIAQLVSGELQRGSIPHSAYGELAFQLSGFAINQLREGIETVLQPRLKCMIAAYMQITQLLIDQYQTGAFEPVSVSGRDRMRTYFDEEIGPELIMGACGHTIELFGQLPQDDLAKMNMANLARQADAQGNPLMPDEWIREEVLKVKNPDIVRDMLGVQSAQQMLPEAMLFTRMQQAENMGHPELARFYYEQLLLVMWRNMQMLMQAGIQPQGAPPGQGSPSGPPGLPSQALPNAFQGFSPAAPGMEQLGGMVAPGTPRPGDRQGVMQ
jgi:hypothetical protein